MRGDEKRSENKALSPPKCRGQAWGEKDPVGGGGAVSRIKMEEHHRSQVKKEFQEGGSG